MSTDAKDFVSSLSIDMPTEEDVAMVRSARPGPRADAKSKKAFVDGGSLVSFTNELSGTGKNDVLNGTLLAQLAADKQYDRLKDGTNWYKFYVKVLGKIGWVIESFNFEEYNLTGEKKTIDHTITDIARGALDKEGLEVVERTLASLQSGPKPFWDVFDKTASGPSKNGNFQILPCNQDISGQVIMSMLTFQFSAGATHERWLWFDYSSTTMHFFKGAQVSTLNNEVYDQVRELIIKKLGDNAAKFINDLDI